MVDANTQGILAGMKEGMLSGAYLQKKKEIDARSVEGNIELPGRQIYVNDFGRVHLSRYPDEYEMVLLGGDYVRLSRGAFRDIGRGKDYPLDCVMSQLPPDEYSKSRVKDFLLSARISELENINEDLFSRLNSKDL